MSPIFINLAVEDDLSEIVMRTVLGHVDREYEVATVYGRGGFGYLKKTCPGWNAGAPYMPYLLLTDLDSYPCPPALLNDWLKVPMNPNFVFRIAVKEVEAWLLADRGNMAKFLSVSDAIVPGNCDLIANPKRALVQLARRSRSRAIREGIPPRNGSTASQGGGYNSLLIPFVRDVWNIETARAASPSLNGAVQKLIAFNPILPGA